MHSITRFALALTALALLATPALAEQPAPASQPQRTVTFGTAETVEGGTQDPDGVIEDVRRRRLQESLVRVRPDFNRRLLQSAETL